MEALREVPLYQSANRPNLLFGCDREMVLLAGLLCAALVFAVATWWAVAIGATTWLLSVAVLTRAAKIDPLLRPIYVRHVRYRRYYAARAGLHSESPRRPKAWR
jgi:type IV secretion system protein TrbD